ncbi:energy transducer TonB [Shewanella corallii]|uniref:Energy transducer TonB n=1 Tax=Shewanella corallii TaxID=560080 RepID=A0ABT0N727_9GAMM|nr:energy transducer TonB [Shewanella corallii]MCL2914243.1 energy transducer TonB [Shewanella corallii]
MTLKPIILALAIATLPCIVQAETSFSDVYAAYQSAVENSDAAEQLKQAKLAFELGKAKFGESHINSANLAMNYANAIKLPQNYDARTASDSTLPQTSDLLEYVVEVYEKEYGEESVELIEPLLKLAHSYQFGFKTESEIKMAATRAVGLAEESSPLFKAWVMAEAATALRQTARYKQRAKKYLFDAYDLYVEHAPENALERNLAAFQVAKYEMEKRRYSKAEELLLNVVEQFQVLDYSNAVELAAHAFLVELYEKKGNREEATKHCLAIGSMKPWKDSQEQEPIFRTPPEFPVSAARRGKEGLVKMQFTVDEMGFVREPEVIKSEGGKAYEKSALKTIKNWRYAPKFENGKPLAALNTVQFDFKLGK